MKMFGWIKWIFYTGVCLAVCLHSIGTSQAAWTWLNPQVTGNNLSGVWGVSDSNYYVVGAGGVIAHWKNGEWIRELESTDDHLLCIHGIDAGCIMAAGMNGSVYMGDGLTWRKAGTHSMETFYGIWGVSRDRFYACGTNGTVFCWDGSDWAPMISGVTDDLYCIWGFSSSDVYTAGDNGTLIHYDGTSWQRMNPGVYHRITGIWGAGPEDLYAGGGSRIHHFDGTGWTGTDMEGMTQILSITGRSPDYVVATGSGTVAVKSEGTWLVETMPSREFLFSAWCSPSGTDYAVGDRGTVMVNSDGTWKPQCSSPDFYTRAIWYSSPDDILVAGNTGSICQWDGSGWQYKNLFPATPLTGIGGFRVDQILATGADGCVLLYDGTAWTSIPWPLKYTASAVWTDGGAEIVTAGESGHIYRRINDSWARMPCPVTEDIIKISGPDANHLACLTVTGNLLHRTGNDWVPWLSYPGCLIRDFIHLAPGDVYIVGTVDKNFTKSDLLLRWTNGIWQELYWSSDQLFNKIWGFSGSELFITAGNQLLHWTGSNMEVITEFPNPDIIHHLWGSGPDDLYINVPPHGVFHWDGVALTDTNFPEGVLLLGGDSVAESDSYAVAEGHVYHWDGTEWSKIFVTYDANLTAIWKFNRDSIYAAGGKTLLHWNGSVWLEVPIPVDADITALWGCSASGRLYLTFVNGDVWSLINRDWDNMETGESNMLTDITGFSENDIYAVGYYGTILHWDGTGWDHQIPPAAHTLRAIHGASPDLLYAAGDNGTVFMYHSGVWIELDCPVEEHLQSVWCADMDTCYIAGRSGTVLRAEGASLARIPCPMFAMINQVHGTDASHFAVGGGYGLTAAWDPSTPVGYLGADLRIPASYIRPGDTFWVRAVLDNPGITYWDNLPVCSVLEVLGQYYFWPGWTPEFDYSETAFPPGTARIDLLPAFTWPDTGGQSLSGIRIYGAVLNAEMTTIIGEMDMETFGFGP